ncbi:SDR family oxidoreductase [Rhodococcus globerulus]|uniref:SDR family oxidoreductase n=1 Tax=Rhodococcus globerulus TaxID=33008 RepID=UPI000526AE91|nr:SDR family oxidoreductase [Rhodococcus globerulus]PVX59532.1 cis-2,3-dihydrobiphenyl-2,3-diol dehydrogenase [Rhodococcus globerulus]
MGSLDGQTCIIVGAAGGIGSAVVARFLADGASVFAVDIDQCRLDRLETACGSDNLQVHRSDCRDWRAAVDTVSVAADRFGPVDVVVSCAGVFDQAVPMIDIPGELLHQALTESVRSNVLAELHLIRAALPMLATRGGRVVLTASFASSSPSGGGIFYTCAKHALAGLVKQLAYELAPQVRVNAVAPGVANTVMTGLSTLEQGQKAAVLDGTETALPLAVMPDAADYGAVYSLLASPSDSAAITGSTFVVDSGLSIRGLGQPAGNTLFERYPE